MKRAVWGVVVLVAGLSPAWGRGGSLKLEVNQRADRVLAEDVDGDGRLDLVVQSGRELRVFRFRSDEGFRSAPDEVIALPATAYLWCFARYGDSKPRVVTSMGSRGLQRHDAGTRFPKGGEDLIVMPTLFEGTADERHEPAFVAFMQDLDGDGLDDALLFAEDELLRFPQKMSGERPQFRLAQRIEIPVDSRIRMSWMAHQPLVQSAVVPHLVFGDLNGDKRTDVAWYRRESVGFLFQGADGRLSDPEARDLAAHKRKPRNTLMQIELPPKMSDFNGDGLLDVALVYPSKGRVHLYFNRSGRTDFTTPDEILSVSDGWSTGIYVEDLDGDGSPEIVMGVVRKLGLSSGIEVFTTKKVRLELLLFRRGAGGRYSNEPVQQLEFLVPYVLQATRTSANVDLTFRPSFAADLDGDGRRDLLVEAGPRAFAIHRGVEKTLIAREASGELAFDAPEGTVSTSLFARDFDGDGRDDLVFTYRGVGRKNDVVEVKLSRP